MSSRICKQCGCTDIDIDSTRGDAVCTGCGSVLEDQIIVSEVQFQENSGGGSSLVGQFVSSEGPGKSFSIGGSFPHSVQKESRTITLQNGKKRISLLASQLNLNQHCVDMAFNFFKMAVSKRMTRGRKTSHVIAACLYLVCRSEKTSHMLLDFSDALQINVYQLGKTYLQLSKELCISLPDIDPALYISRFAHALQFGDKTHEVSMTAMRLVQRMKRDWMSTGRRPSGLCGAALLVAARIHDFSRNIKQIIKVVKVCQSTLRKRLIEFEETPSSQLTIEEFQTIDLEEEHDPPSFTESKRRTKKIYEQNKIPEYASEVSKLQEEIEETLMNQKPTGIFAAYCKMAEDSCSIDSETSRLSDLTDDDKSRNISRNSSEDSLINSDCQNLSTNPGLSTTEISNSQKSLERSNCQDTSQTNHEHVKNQIVVGSEVEIASVDSGGVQSRSGGVPSLGLGVETLVDKCLENSNDSLPGTTGVTEDELDLTGIDDQEINKYILAEREVLLKTKIWMEENADYLKEMELKEEKKRKEEEEEAKKPPEKRKRTIKRKKRPPATEAATAQEAIQKIMHEKKISCKINYDVLNDLNVKSAKRDKPVITESNSITRSIFNDTTPAVGRLRKPSVSLDLKQETPVRKKMKTEDILPILPSPITTGIPSTSDVVIESGPVQYHQKDEIDEEDDEYFEEEDNHLSAAQLLGHTTGADDEYDYDMD
ncbi:transcription factor TFIIIB subunit brf1 [Mactra antiquata]